MKCLKTNLRNSPYLIPQFCYFSAGVCFVRWFDSSLRFGHTSMFARLLVQSGQFHLVVPQGKSQALLSKCQNDNDNTPWLYANMFMHEYKSFPENMTRIWLQPINFNRDPNVFFMSLNSFYCSAKHLLEERGSPNNTSPKLTISMPFKQRWPHRTLMCLFPYQKHFDWFVCYCRMWLYFSPWK